MKLLFVKVKVMIAVCGNDLASDVSHVQLMTVGRR